jgi:acetyl esterase/lipase
MSLDEQSQIALSELSAGAGLAVAILLVALSVIPVFLS